MHLRYVAFLVASSVAVTTLVESTKNASLTPPSLAPPPSTFDRADSPTNSVEGLALPDPPEDERFWTTAKLAASPFYKAVHRDVSISRNFKATMKRKTIAVRSRKPEKQYSILQLDTVPDPQLLTSERWKMWVVLVCQESSNEDPAEVIARVMAQVLGEERLLKILVDGVNDSSTQEIAEALKAVRQQQWLDGPFSPDMIFKQLDLHKTAQSLFDNALYPAWFEFLQAYQSKHSASKLTEVKCLKKIFKTDTDLLTVLTSASNLSSQRGQVVLKQLFEEQKDPKKFSDALMLSWSGLRAFFAKNKLHNDAQQEEFMKLTSPERMIDHESMKKLREFMRSSDIDYPKPEDVLRVALDEDSPILTVWVDFLKSYTVRMPVTDAVIKVFELLTSKDIAATTGPSIVRSFVNDWVQKSVEPSKVYKMLLSNKGQDAKESQDVWKTFVHEYQMKNKIHVPEENDIFHEMDEDALLKKIELNIPMEIKSYKGLDAEEVQGIWKTFILKYLREKHLKKKTVEGEVDKVAVLEKNELEVPEEIRIFMELSAKLSNRDPDDDQTMRVIVWNWMEHQPHPEQVLTTLLLDAKATRLLDHWVKYIGEYLEKIRIAKLNEETSNPDKYSTYVKMLNMLSMVRDLGHLPSRTIMNQHELKWLDSKLSPSEAFRLLELDRGTRDLLNKAESLVLAQREAAEKLSNTAGTSGSPKAGSFRPVQKSVKPSVKVIPPLLDEDVATLYDKALSNLLNNPLLAIFLDFEKHYNGRHKTDTTLLMTLLETFGDSSVAKLLNAAKEPSHSVQNLQTELFHHYLKTGKGPGDVLRFLGLTGNQGQNSRLYTQYGQVYVEFLKSKTSYRWDN